MQIMSPHHDGLPRMLHFYEEVCWNSFNKDSFLDVVAQILLNARSLRIIYKKVTEYKSLRLKDLPRK